MVYQNSARSDNLKRNKCDPARYTVWSGDNRITTEQLRTKSLRGKCDRIAMGLLPTSEPWLLYSSLLGKILLGNLSKIESRIRDYSGRGTWYSLDWLFGMIRDDKRKNHYSGVIRDDSGRQPQESLFGSYSG